MVFADWTCSGTGAECVLDSSIKYAGTSSFKGKAFAQSGIYSILTHNTFSESQVQILLWVYRPGTNVYGVVGHANYGELICSNSATATWQRFRTSFWYDATSNTKWGRVERWDDGAWVQIGTDTNYGTGSPGAGAIYLKTVGNPFTAASNCYFDELEVYS